MSTSSRFVAVVSSLLLSATLVACGGNQTAQPKSEPADQTAAPTEQTTAPADKTEASTDKTATQDDYVKGTIDGNTYTHALFGVAYTIPDGYEFATDEQVAKLNNTTLEALKDDEYREALENGTAFIEMEAHNADASQNVNATIERFDPALAEEYTAKQLRDQVYLNTKDDNSALESIGCTDITNEMSSVTVDGEELPVAKTNATYQGTKIYQAHVIFVADHYILNIAFTSRDASALDGMLTGLKLVK